jgi:hypothetical protein
MWKEPIIEIISANNEKLKTLKESVSLEHFMPYNILPEAKSIIDLFDDPKNDSINEWSVGDRSRIPKT